MGNGSGPYQEEACGHPEVLLGVACLLSYGNNLPDLKSAIATCTQASPYPLELIVDIFMSSCGSASTSLPTSHDLVESIEYSRDLDTTLGEPTVGIVELSVDQRSSDNSRVSVESFSKHAAHAYVTAYPRER
jgi:hypothetical protein